MIYSLVLTLPSKIKYKVKNYHIQYMFVQSIELRKISIWAISIFDTNKTEWKSCVLNWIFAKYPHLLFGLGYCFYIINYRFSENFRIKIGQILRHSQWYEHTNYNCAILIWEANWYKNDEYINRQKWKCLPKNFGCKNNLQKYVPVLLILKFL